MSGKENASDWTASSEFDEVHEVLLCSELVARGVQRVDLAGLIKSGKLGGCQPPSFPDFIGTAGALFEGALSEF